VETVSLVVVFLALTDKGHDYSPPVKSYGVGWKFLITQEVITDHRRAVNVNEFWRIEAGWENKPSSQYCKHVITTMAISRG